VKKSSRKLSIFKVLIVEDEPTLLKMVQKYLDYEGMMTTIRSDGRSALKFLETETPDLICLDLVLPEVSGYDVCDFVRKTPRLSAVPVLMMSARTLPADRAHAEEVGVNAYLTKPFTREDFMAVVRRLLTAHP
jgi:DNA-binding response OmpR family regulator